MFCEFMQLLTRWDFEGFPPGFMGRWAAALQGVNQNALLQCGKVCIPCLCEVSFASLALFRGNYIQP